MDTTNQPEMGYFNRFDLVHYANVFVATKLNILTFEWPNVLSIYFDLEPVYYNTSIKDTLRADEDKKLGVSSFALGANLKCRTKEVNNFSADFAYSVFIPHLYSQRYSDKVNTQIKEHGGRITPEMILSSDRNPIHVVDIRIKYNPPNKKMLAHFSDSYCFIIVTMTYLGNKMLLETHLYHYN